MTEQTLPKRGLSRRSWLVIALAVVLVVAVVAVGAAVRHKLRTGTRAGTLVQVDDALTLSDPGTRTANVLLPSGQLKLQVTGPATHFSADADPENPELELDRVQDSGRWIGVGWTLSPLPMTPDQVATLGRAPEQFQVVLVADGTRYDLQAGRSADASADEDSHAGLYVPTRKLHLVDHKRVYVALPKQPKSVAVDVTYDGVTQRFDPAVRGLTERGLAAPLYQNPAPFRTTRPAATDSGFALSAPGFGFLRDRNDQQVTLSVRPITALPYVPGLGWAKAGRAWLSVPVFTNVVDPFVFWPAPEAQAHALYTLKLRSTTVTLDGKRAALELPYYLQNPKATASVSEVSYIWDVPATAVGQTVALHQVYVSGPPDQDSPPDAPKQATASGDVTLTLSR